MDVEVRPLAPADFDGLTALEDELFGRRGEKVLGPFYVRLACDMFGDTSFIVLADKKPVGYALSFVKDREGYCSTLAVLPEFQRTRVVHRLVLAMIEALADRVDSLWFTVSETNLEARALHATLGAREVERHEAYFGPGEPRIVSRIERDAFERLRSRLERAGLIERRLSAERTSGTIARAL